MPPRIVIAPERIAEGRRLYEQTLTPMGDIAALLGIQTRSFAARPRASGDPVRQINTSAILALDSRLRGNERNLGRRRRK